MLPVRRYTAVSLCLISLLISTTARADVRIPPFPTSQELTRVPNDPALSWRLSYLERTVEEGRIRNHVPGAALVVVRDGKIVYIKGFGLRDLKKKLPVTPDTLFAIGSSTKAFTAMTAMIGVDDGKLDLKASPRRYLPYFKISDPSIDTSITVSDLLCHRSGLARTDLFWLPGKLNRREILETVGTIQPAAKLGEKFQYQNVMYMAAGECVAAAEKQSWDRFLETRIFSPLGMKRTNLTVDATHREKDYALPYGYRPDLQQFQLQPMRKVNGIAPAGAINSSVREMAQWLRLMLSDGTLDGHRYITSKSMSALFEPHMPIGGGVDYGYGWFLRTWKGHKVAEHGGNIDGFNAQVAIMPDQKLGMVLLTNIFNSPLTPQTMETVWKTFVDVPMTTTPVPVASGEAEPQADPQAEVGIYRLEQAKLDFAVTLKDGKLFVQGTNQPQLPLISLGGRRYKAGPPAPDGILFTFHPAPDNPSETMLLLEQNGARMELKRAEAQAKVTAPFTAEELMGKVITALGGEANLSRHHSMVIRMKAESPGQGVQFTGVIYSRTPNSSSTQIKMYAHNRQVATIREYFDGKEGGTINSFSLPDIHSEKQLVNDRINNNFCQELNWKSLFKKVEITGKSKVGDEECWVVRKTPENGDPVTDYISAKTFLPLRREIQTFVPEYTMTITQSDTFSDYRPVGGMLIAFRRESTGGVDMYITVTDVTLDARLSDSLFRRPRH